MSKTETTSKQYRSAMFDVSCMAMGGLDEISSMARMLLLAMESPDFYRHPEHIGNVVQSIWGKALEISNVVACEAERVECLKDDLAQERRRAAWAAARKQVADEQS